MQRGASRTSPGLRLPVCQWPSERERAQSGSRDHVREFILYLQEKEEKRDP